MLQTEAFRLALVAGLCAVIGCWGSLLLLFGLVPITWVRSSHAFVVVACMCAFSVAGGACGVACFKRIAASQPLLKAIGGFVGFALIVSMFAVNNKLDAISRERGPERPQGTTDRKSSPAEGIVAFMGAMWLSRKVSDLVYRTPEGT